MKKKDDRLCVIGSFPGVTENTEKKPDQFFGAPLVANGTGRICSDTLINVLSEWDIPELLVCVGILHRPTQAAKKDLPPTSSPG